MPKGVATSFRFVNPDTGEVHHLELLSSRDPKPAGGAIAPPFLSGSPRSGPASFTRLARPSSAVHPPTLRASSCHLARATRPGRAFVGVRYCDSNHLLNLWLGLCSSLSVRNQ